MSSMIALEAEAGQSFHCRVANGAGETISLTVGAHPRTLKILVASWAVDRKRYL